MRARALLAALLVTSAGLVLLDSGDRSPVDPLRTGVDAVLGPVQRAAGGAANGVADAVASLVDRTDRAELRRLEEENAALRRELRARGADGRTADEWRSLLGLTGEGDRRLLPARVVGGGRLLGFERTVTLDVGERDGVAAGMTVVAGEGLVGRVVRTGPWTAVVLLLDDPGSGVGARDAQTGLLGLARGAGAGRLQWVQVQPGDVAVGATLLTTGGSTYAADVPVGRVTALGPARSGLPPTAEVEPFVDGGRLDLVAVVLDGPRTEPRAPVS